MTYFQPTNSDTVWQREKTTIIQAITKAAPSTVLLDVLCVPLEVVGGAVSRTVVVCTKTRIDNATRAAIRTRIAALNPCEDRFDVVYRTGEITRIYAEVIGASREWIAAVWDEDGDDVNDDDDVCDVSAGADQGSVVGGKGDGGEAEETLTMVDDLVKAEVAKALREIEADAAAHQVDAEVSEPMEQIEADVKAERRPRVRFAIEPSESCKSTPEKASPAVIDAVKEQVKPEVRRPCLAKPATRPSGLQPPRPISAIPSRLQAPTKPAPPRGLPRPHSRSQSLSVCQRQSSSPAPKTQDQQQQQQQQQQQSKTLPRVQGMSRLQAPRKSTSLSAPPPAPVQSKLKVPQAKSRIVQPRAKMEPACEPATPRVTTKLLTPPQVRGLPRPSTRMGMLPRALPRPTRG
ncbi:uncharacterized protein PpBr36_10159 [Pyricularia pennisetigena]|uniref:uncharacterized protein n=1 Tax=Pyricularia pennisetigena TaxID=1578925 RepID=UPI0011511184|nr:uncharacterized protein PpBr36_10159 [Pyricularia pennisetigena]TLS21585.1 hypothetical protein PpBr36_10159 [Pyricularia pennisetigena]